MGEVEFTTLPLHVATTFAITFRGSTAEAPPYEDRGYQPNLAFATMGRLMLFQTSDGHGDLIGQATLLEPAKLPQAQQISHPVPSCNVLFFEPSTLRTTYCQGRSGAHGAPVENDEEESNT